ncbi:glycosyltransferase family 4 protein [Candidatus Poribacteria bacterium]
MKIVELIPGSGDAFYCENCLRDGTFFKALHDQGHDILRAPLYLPIASNELEEHTADSVFFGGVNVYLQQKSALFRKTPRWIDRVFDSERLLKWAAGKSGMTDATELGELTLSMLRGEEGRQVKELNRLVTWLKTKETPDVIHLSNALLLGMARQIKEQIHVPVICSLQDEDMWIDALPEPQRQTVWDTMAERATDADGFIAVSHYYKDVMCNRLEIPCEQVHVVYNGIDTTKGYQQAELPVDPPVVGFLERECQEKGLGILVEAFIILRKSGRIPNLKLRAEGGSMGMDESFLKEIHQRLADENLSDDVEILPNPGIEERLDFLRGLSVLSVPAEHKEAFGIYIIEALASGVPVVQPRHGAFPELLEATGGGILYEPNDPDALADAIESLVLDPQRARELGRRGREVVLKKFSVEYMACEMVKAMETVTKQGTPESRDCLEVVESQTRV